MLQCISRTKIGVRPSLGNDGPRRSTPAHHPDFSFGDPMNRAGGTDRLPRRSLFRSGASARLAAALALSALLWAVILWAQTA